MRLGRRAEACIEEPAEREDQGQNAHGDTERTRVAKGRCVGEPIGDTRKGDDRRCRSPSATDGCSSEEDGEPEQLGEGVVEDRGGQVVHHHQRKQEREEAGHVERGGASLEEAGGGRCNREDREADGGVELDSGGDRLEGGELEPAKGLREEEHRDDG